MPDDTRPMPGRSEFSAEEEMAMRTASMWQRHAQGEPLAKAADALGTPEQVRDLNDRAMRESLDRQDDEMKGL